MAGMRVKAAIEQLRSMLSFGALTSRISGCAYSAGSQQINSGDKTTKDGSTDQTCTVKPPDDKIIKLEAQVLELTECYKRALAESEAVKRRTQTFVTDAKLYGIQSLCRDLVEVADILENAVTEAEETGKKEELEVLNSLEGKLRKIFKKHGLQKMSPVGGNYDPYDHEIIAHVPAKGMRPGSVAIVKQDGYKLHGRTIRHARVGIAMETQASRS